VKRSNRAGPVVVLAASLLLVAAGAAAAKPRTGGLRGTVCDADDRPLAGATVTLTTATEQLVKVTNDRGEFSFTEMKPARHLKLKAELKGYYTYEVEKLRIRAGRDTTLVVTMSSPDLWVEYAPGPPQLIDEHRIFWGSTVSQDELKGIPTPRDPWALLPTTPGVQLDRVDVGGRESARQPVYAGPGSTRANSIWTVDRAAVTDMAALGGSPSTYDFDDLEEVQITTGGPDVRTAAGGVVVNLETKRGSPWRGSARYLNTPAAAQSSSSFGNRPPTLGDNGSPHRFDRIRGIDEFGAEAGGTVVREHLWLWGAYGNQKISAFAGGGIPYDAKLPAYDGRIDAQLGNSNILGVSGLRDDEQVDGRDAALMRPLETAWNQRRTGSGPTFARVEDTQILSSGAYFSGTFSAVNGGFHLTPIGGPASTAYLDAESVWHHSFTSYDTNRPQRQGKLDGSFFFNTGNLSHFLRCGASYRRVTTTSLEQWSGAGWILDGAWLGAPAGDNLLVAARAASLDVTEKYTSGYLQDEIELWGHLRGYAGVRYDLQQGRNEPSTSPANPVLPALLPAYRFSGSGAGFSWKDFAPRLGVSYAAGKNRETLLRASYSRFADQLGAGTVAFTNPAAVQSYFYFTTPQTGPGTPTILSPGLGYSGNVNPATRLPIANNAVAGNLSAGLTDEGLFSVEQALSEDMTVGIELNYRRLSNLLDQDLLVFDCSGAAAGCSGDPSSTGRIARRGDYQPVTVTTTLPGGRVVPVTFYTLERGVFTRNGQILVNGDRTQRFQAASLVVTRRLSYHWLLRGHFTVDSWRWQHTGGLPDPTEGPAGGARDGDPVLTASGAGAGPKAYVYIGAKWTGSLNALYQVMPEQAWGFDVAGNFTARQGYPLPYYISQPVDVNGNYSGVPREAVLAAGSPASVRAANVYDLDLRIAKELTFHDWALTLGVDCFNVFNSSTVLQRVANLGVASRSPGTGGFVYEVLDPRIVRFGARINFR
jgi:hypothetical protein